MARTKEPHQVTEYMKRVARHGRGIGKAEAQKIKAIAVKYPVIKKKEQ